MYAYLAGARVVETIFTRSALAVGDPYGCSRKMLSSALVGKTPQLYSRRQNRAFTWGVVGEQEVEPATGPIFLAMETDGGAMPAQLTRSNNLQAPQTFSPDGRLVFTETIPGKRAELRVVSLESERGQIQARVPQPLFNTPRGMAFPSFSPDGRWLAYSNAQSGQFQVYVRAFPDNGRQVQISDSGGIMLLWSPKGHELFYRTTDQRIMVIGYAVQGDAFIPQRPRLWCSKRIANIGDNWNLDLAPTEAASSR